MAKIDGTTAMYNALYNYHYPERYKEFSGMPVGRDLAAKTAAEGLAQVDLVILGNKIPDDSALGKMMTTVGDKMQDPTAVSAVIVQKWKQNPAIIDKLQRDLTANPAQAQKITNALTNNPNLAASVLQKYDGSNLAAILPAAAPAADAKSKPSTVSPAASTSAPAAGAPAAPKPAQTSSPRAKTEPVAVASAPASAPDMVIPPPAPLDMAALGKAEFAKFADMKDDQIKAQINPALTKGLAHGIADYAVDKFGVDKALADNFKERINRDGKLREAIEKNLKENPDFVRQLAKTMQDGKPLPPAARGVARSAMSKLMENPEDLAKADYVQGMSSQLQTAGTANQGLGFLKNMFGIDTDKMFSGIGGWFNKIASFAQNLMQQFSSGNFLSMRNGGMNLFKALGAAMDQASMDSDAEGLQLPHMNSGMIAGKDGKFTHGVELKDENGKVQLMSDGKPFLKQVQNTVEVETINGSKHTIIPSNGLTIFRDSKGNYRVPVGTQAEGGQITEMTTLVMSEKQFDDYKRKLRDELGFNGRLNMAYIEPATVTSIAPKTGQVEAPQVQVQPTLTQSAPKTVAPPGTQASNEPRYERDGTSG